MDYRHVLGATLPDSGRDSYEYLLNTGDLWMQRRANLTQLTRSVDAGGELTQVSYSGGIAPFRVRYDRDLLGREVLLSEYRSAGGSPAATTALEYDVADRVVRERRVEDGRTYELVYGYDGLGNIATMTYPSGLMVRLERQSADASRLARVVAVEAGVETVLADDTSYSTAGLLTGYTMGNGLRYDIEREAGGRVRRITTGLPGDPTPDVLDLTYYYDSVGNITDIVDAVDTDRTAAYGDDLDRLVSADGWWGALDWAYDHIGNRLSETRDGVLSTHAHQAGTSRLLTVTDTSTGLEEHALEYDQSGSAVRYDDLLLDYDAADRLIRIRDRGTGDTIQENAYDWKFRRTKRVEYLDTDGDTVRETTECTAFLYDLQDRLVAEHECATGTPVAEYVHLEGYLVLGVRRDGAWYWYVSDHLPTPRKVVDAAGDVAWDGRSEPWGWTEAVLTSVPQPLAFPDQYADGSSDVVLHSFRHYAQRVGRFVQAEPLHAPLVALEAATRCPADSGIAPSFLAVTRGLSGYTYAADAPTQRWDWLALYPFGGHPSYPDWPNPFDDCAFSWVLGYAECWLRQGGALAAYGAARCRGLCLAAAEFGGYGAGACWVCTGSYFVVRIVTRRIFGSCTDAADAAYDRCRCQR